MHRTLQKEEKPVEKATQRHSMGNERIHHGQMKWLYARIKKYIQLFTCMVVFNTLGMFFQVLNGATLQ